MDTAAVIAMHHAVFHPEPKRRPGRPTIGNRYDQAIRDGRSNGLSCEVIGKSLGLRGQFVCTRVHAMGLPVASVRIWTEGMTVAQREVYRLYRRKGFEMIEARRAALGVE